MQDIAVELQNARTAHNNQAKQTKIQIAQLQERLQETEIQMQAEVAKNQATVQTLET